MGIQDQSKVDLRIQCGNQDLVDFLPNFVTSMAKG